MKRTLFYSSQDTRESFKYNSDIKKELFHLGGNSGNMVFTNAIQTYLHQNGTKYDLTDNPHILLKNETSNDYECCIVNCSNWIRPGNTEFISTLTNIFTHTKIPIFLIGLGTQTSEDIGFKEFDNNFLSIIKQFLKSVLETGGAFGLRGYYTAELFDLLGFKNDYTVTGCPSLFQMGKNLQVKHEKVDFENFSPFFNGNQIFKIKGIEDYFEKFTKSIFVDQDRYYKALKYPNTLNNNDIKNPLTQPDIVLNLLANNRIKLFSNIRNWSNLIIENKYNFSFGSRFHGSIVPILCNIPSLILTIDSRTIELTDYFNIPTISAKSINNRFDLFDEYLKTDYTNFNKNFNQVYANFEDFIIKNNIPLELPQVNPPSPIAPEYNDCFNINKDVEDTFKEYIKFKPSINLPYFDRRKLFIIKKRFNLMN